MAEFENMMGAMGGLSPLDVPTPGESLTADPEIKAPYEKPPVHTDVTQAMEDMFMRITDPENMEEVLDLLRAEIPVEQIAQVFLFGGFREGKFNPDLMLLMIEPTIYTLLWLAEYAGIDAVLDPEDDLASDLNTTEEDFNIAEAPRPEGVSDNLISLIEKQAGKGEE